MNSASMLPVPQHGLIKRRWTFLLFLHNNPGFDTATDIVKFRHLSKSHVSKSIQSLKERGWLAAFYQDNNRRTIHLKLCKAADARSQMDYRHRADCFCSACGFHRRRKTSIKTTLVFLTIKPIIYLANISEEELGKEDNSYVKEVKDYATRENAKVVSLCAKVEEELSELSSLDKKEMLEALGEETSGLDKLIKATYDLLGLATYFTVGPR